MSLGITHKVDNGVHFIGGTVDEHADFQKLLDDLSPVLKINLREVKWINSLGVRKMVALAQALGDRAVEFHEVPPVFVEAINIIPLLIGGQSHVGRVKSARLPLACSGGHHEECSVAISQIYVDGGFTFPDLPCKVCKMPLSPDLDSELDDYFFFLTLGS